MPRSPESIERRRAYVRQWHRDHPDYKRAWVKAHRQQERERAKRWREHNQDLVKAQRLRYNELHPHQPIQREELPEKFIGHPFFETARFICGPKPYFDSCRLWEETMAETVLALVEGRDPNEAARRTRSREWRWLNEHVSFFPNVDVRQDGKIVFVAKSDVLWEK